MIRDTSAQDHVIAAPAGAAAKKKLAWLLGAIALLALTVFLLSGWLSSERSVDASRLRIAEVSRGTLIRDPLNKYTARDPFGANSVVYGEGYCPPDWTVDDPDARAAESQIP